MKLKYRSGNQIIQLLCRIDSPQNIRFSFHTIGGRGVLTPLFYKDPPPPPPLFFKFCPIPHPPHLQPSPSVLFLLPSFTEWVNASHFMCYFTSWYSGSTYIEPYVRSTYAVVPEWPCCVFYATRCQVYWGLIHNLFLASLWFDITQTLKDILQDTQGPIDWYSHINIF